MVQHHIGTCRAVWVPGQDLPKLHLMCNCGKRILSLHCTLYVHLCMHMLMLVTTCLRARSSWYEYAWFKITQAMPGTGMPRPAGTYVQHYGLLPIRGSGGDSPMHAPLQPTSLSSPSCRHLLLPSRWRSCCVERCWWRRPCTSRWHPQRTASHFNFTLMMSGALSETSAWAQVCNR